MVEAKLNYLAQMAEKPVYYMCKPPPGIPEENMQYDPVGVSIEDACRLEPPPSLQREGFEPLRHNTAAANLFDPDTIRGTYFPEIGQLVTLVTGARKVMVFDHNVRSSMAVGTEGGTPEREPDTDEVVPDKAQPPVRIAHNDYTDLSGPQRVRDLLDAHEAKAARERRFAIINAWKPIRGPVEQVPLAVCDARSISPSDLVPTDLVYADRTGEISLLTFKPAQRWFYYPDMRDDEAILLKCYDSDRTPSRFTAHTAFDDPTSPAKAQPRESIEVRTLALY